MLYMLMEGEYSPKKCFVSKCRPADIPPNISNQDHESKQFPEMLLCVLHVLTEADGMSAPVMVM